MTEYASDEDTASKGNAKRIGVGAGKFLVVQRNFARILPNLPEKYCKLSDLHKKGLNSGIHDKDSGIHDNPELRPFLQRLGRS